MWVGPVAVQFRIFPTPRSFYLDKKVPGIFLWRNVLFLVYSYYIYTLENSSWHPPASSWRRPLTHVVFPGVCRSRRIGCAGVWGAKTCDWCDEYDYVSDKKFIPRNCGCILGGGFKYFYFHPYLGKIPILTNIFQRGSNHQPVLFCT